MLDVHHAHTPAKMSSAALEMTIHSTDMRINLTDFTHSDVLYTLTQYGM